MIVVCECKLLNLVDWLSPNVELLKVLLLYVCANDLHGATTQLIPAAAALRRASESAIGNATEQPFLPISPLDHI